jgi:hypothetical protein
LFCGASSRDLVPLESPEGIESPVGAVPFAIDDASARAAFATFAGSSFWYPNDLRRATLELHHLLVPAWAWTGDLESHWTGLVKAGTKSGKRPVAGAESRRFEQILVPASQSLTLVELAALGRFDEGEITAFDPDTVADPYEVSEVTRSAARTAAQAEMSRRHRVAIESAHALLSSKVSGVVLTLEGRPVLVPVFIGAYRYRDGLYRILVNGQTGVLHGTAPTSWWKVMLAVLAVIATVIAVGLGIAGCSGGLALLNSL